MVAPPPAYKAADVLQEARALYESRKYEEVIGLVRGNAAVVHNVPQAVQNLFGTLDEKVAAIKAQEERTDESLAQTLNGLGSFWRYATITYGGSAGAIENSKGILKEIREKSLESARRRLEHNQSRLAQAQAEYGTIPALPDHIQHGKGIKALLGRIVDDYSGRGDKRYNLELLQSAVDSSRKDVGEQEVLVEKNKMEIVLLTAQYELFRLYFCSVVATELPKLVPDKI